MPDRLETYDEDSWDMPSRRERVVMSDGGELFETAADPDHTFPTARGRLSAAEIEALLRPDLTDYEPEEPARDPAAKDVSPRPIPGLDMPGPIAAPEPHTAEHDMQMAQRMTARLSLALRRDCGLKTAATSKASRRTSFNEALSGLEKSSAIACFAGRGGEIAAMLALPAPLTNALIETACGGKTGAGAACSRRVLTPMDAALLEALIRPLGPAIAQGLSFARVETDLGFAQALAPPVEAHLILMELRLGEESLPAALILSEDDLFEDATAIETPASPLRHEPSSLLPVSPRPVTAVLTARIASLSVPISRLSDLKAGSTLLLGVPADQPVELLSGGRDGALAAEGRIGRKGGKMAVSITRRGPALD